VPFSDRPKGWQPAHRECHVACSIPLSIGSASPEEVLGGAVAPPQFGLPSARLPRRGVSAQARGVAPVGFLEYLARPLAVGGLFGKRLRVPFAAVGGKEIAAINVDRGGEFGRRVGDRMDDVFAAPEFVAYWTNNGQRPVLGLIG
jgi:hypothetical protein